MISKEIAAQTFFSLLNECGQDRYYKNEPKFVKKFIDYLEKIEAHKDYEWITKKVGDQSTEDTKTDALKFATDNKLRSHRFFLDINW